MATSLDKLENKVQIHHLHVRRFHTVKRLLKSVQYIRKYSTKSAVLRRNYWTDLHQNFTRYSGISGAI